MNALPLKNKVAVVTGGAGNLGPTFAEALAEAGAHVVLADLSATKKRGDSEARRIAEVWGRDVSFVSADVGRETSVKTLMRRVMRRHGRLDILVNGAIGAGKHFFGGVEKYSKKDFDEVLSVTVTGTFLCSRIAVPLMKKRGGGVIVNIGSIYGVVGADQRIYGRSGINSPASYAAAKGAVINLTRYLAVYWAKDKVRVNCISPGGVFNNQPKAFRKAYARRTPLGRMADRNELKGALVYLAGGASAYVTGQNLIVDGGWTAW